MPAMTCMLPTNARGHDYCVGEEPQRDCYVAKTCAGMAIARAKNRNGTVMLPKRVWAWLLRGRRTATGLLCCQRAGAWSQVSKLKPGFLSMLPTRGGMAPGQQAETRISEYAANARGHVTVATW